MVRPAKKRSELEAYALAVLQARGLEAAWPMYKAYPGGEVRERLVGELVKKLVGWETLTGPQFGLIANLLEQIRRKKEGRGSGLSKS